MRTRIKVADLSLAQWAWLNKNLPADQVFAPGDVRMCVELEITAEQAPIHVELPARAFIVLIERLAQVDEGRELLGPKWNQEYQDRTGDRLAACEHDAAAVKETPSAFKGAKPTITYADGCQSYGPYQ